MPDMKWTTAQQAAIYDRGGTLLVSAAAGSGKTAVLTERVVQLLQDAENPVQADRLLIVTFTNAAAAELRARIATRIEQVLLTQPQNNHLRRQKMLLQRAYICTIDSFCLQMVQQYFTALDVPPDFTLADAGVAQQLKSEALAQTLEQAYQNPAFCDFVDLYGKGRSDGAAGAAILQLYEFLRTMPNEAAFLQRVRAQWDPQNVQGQRDACEGLFSEVADKAWLGLSFAKDAVTLCEQDFEEAVSAAIESKKTAAAQQKAEAKVAEKYQKILGLLEGLADALTSVWNTRNIPKTADFSHKEDWGFLYKTLAPYRTGERPMPGLKGSGVRLTGANGARTRQAAERAAALFQNILALVPCSTLQDDADRTIAHPMVCALCDAQQAFATLFYQKKLEKKVLEFADLEHLTLQLLRWEGGKPTPLAQSIAAGFDAVMVDEYQDTNQLQKVIYRRLANEAGDNLFYVGDVKQSIYRFRKADPSIFGAKLQHFTPLAAGQARPAPAQGVAGQNALLALDANFRSAPAVVGGINFIFEQVMSHYIGGVDYGDGQRLVCKSGGITGSMGLLLDAKGGQDPAQVAAKIAQLVALGAAGDARGMVRDGAALRGVQYHDCCILLSARAPFAKYADALAALGIASYADSAEDLLSATHIQPLVALLQIIDNPAQDIPLAAAMRSVIFAFTDDDLLALRTICPKGSLYGAVAQVAQQVRQGVKAPAMAPSGGAPANTAQPTNPAFAQRIADFYEALSALRRLSHTLAPDALLDEIFATTHYLALIGAMEQGARRREDVAKFAAYVARAGANGIESLVRNIAQTKASGGLVETAPGKAKQGCVTIMTVHRSKGLQFPVVFAANLDRHFNTDDLKKKLQLHPMLGLGLQLRAGAQGGNYHTLLSTALRYTEKRELYSEQMRLLYVALTRAQDHLYLSGSAKGYEKQIKTLAYGMEGQMYQLTKTEDCMGAICFMDWVLRALLRHPTCALLRADCGDASLHLAQAEYPIVVEEYQTPAQKAVAGSHTRALTAAPDAALVQQLLQGFAWQYPHAPLTTLPAKVSVTSLVHKEQGTILSRPAFLAKDGMTAAEKGTALHAFLENADFDTLKAARAQGTATLCAALRAEQTRQKTEQLMQPEIAALLDMAAVEDFFLGDAFDRIANASKVYREYAFITGLPASEVLAATAAIAGGSVPAGASNPSPQSDTTALHPVPTGADATVLVQGIADLLLVYPDHLELLDYKSDHGKSEVAYRKAYAKQLDYYAKAIEKRFAPLNITYKALYSFDLAKLIPVHAEDSVIE